MSKRTDMVAQLIQREASAIIQHELGDPHIGFVTITDVKVSPDLRNADLYVSVLGASAEVADTLKHLKRALGYIRRLIAPRLDLRYVPRLGIVHDDTELKAERIERLIDDLHGDAGERESGQDPRDGSD